jgi:hypothetical protein
VLLLVDDWGLLSAVGVATAGVVAVDPPEHRATAGHFVRPGVRALEEFALKGGIEGLGERVVGALSG